MMIHESAESKKLAAMTELMKIEYLAYFHAENKVAYEFTLEESDNWLALCGFSKPNRSRLKSRIKSYTGIVKGKNQDRFMLASKRFLELKTLIGPIETANQEVLVVDGVLPSDIFGIDRKYIQQLGRQINACYDQNIFDGCAVLMRRLFEILLIHTFEKFSIDGLIRDPMGNFIMLSEIVKVAKTRTDLSLSRNTIDGLDSFRDIGNFAAHKIFFTTRKSDIDSIRINYRAMIEELLYKSGLRS